jgi:hypothetical protein
MEVGQSFCAKSRDCRKAERSQSEMSVLRRRNLCGSAMMPIGVLENESCNTTCRTEDNAAERQLRKLLVAAKLPCRAAFSAASQAFHGELPQTGSPGFMGLMIPQAGTHFELFGTPPVATTSESLTAGPTSGAASPIELNFIPEDSWTSWQQSSAKSENSKSS